MTIMVFAKSLGVEIEITPNMLIYPFYAIFIYFDNLYNQFIEFIYYKFKSLFLGIADYFSEVTKSSDYKHFSNKYDVSKGIFTTVPTNSGSITEDMKNAYDAVKDNETIKNATPNYEDNGYSKTKIFLIILVSFKIKIILVLTAPLY